MSVRALADGVYLRGRCCGDGRRNEFSVRSERCGCRAFRSDFRVEFPRIAGNFAGPERTSLGRRTAGSGCKVAVIDTWRAFISDAVAELNDRRLVATAGNGGLSFLGRRYPI